MFLLDFVADLRFDLLNLGVAVTGFITFLPIIIYFYYKKKKVTRIKFSSLTNLKKTKPSLKVKLYNLPFYLRIFSVFFLLIAFSHPYLEKEVENHENKEKSQKKKEKKLKQRIKIEVPTKGIAIQLLIDRSGSMGIVNDTRRGIKYNYMKFENTLLSKIDVVKIISKRFIKGTIKTKQKDNFFSGRSNDMIGLFTFARYPFVACPLTLRHELLLDYINQLEVVSLPEEDGTYIGYALERAILQIIDARSQAKKNNAYHVKSSIIILVTDGEQIIRPEDRQNRHKSYLPSEAAELAKNNDIKIYSIAVSPDVIYSEQGNAIGSGRRFSVDEIETCATITNGKFYFAENGDSLLKIYNEINKLEKSKLPSKKQLDVQVEKIKDVFKKKIKKIELFSLFLWSGFLTFLLEIILTTLYFRRIP